MGVHVSGPSGVGHRCLGRPGAGGLRQPAASGVARHRVGAVVAARCATDVVIADGWVYTTGTPIGASLRAGNGTPGWSVTPEHSVDGLFAVDNSTVYVWDAGFRDGRSDPSVLRALRVSDGSERWSYNVPARVGQCLDRRIGGLARRRPASSSQGQFSSLIALHRPDGAVLERLGLRRQHPTLTDRAPGIAVGGGKVAAYPGRSPGNPEPRRVRVLGLAGVRPGSPPQFCDSVESVIRTRTNWCRQTRPAPLRGRSPVAHCRLASGSPRRASCPARPLRSARPR